MAPTSTSPTSTDSRVYFSETVECFPSVEEEAAKEAHLHRKPRFPLKFLGLTEDSRIPGWVKRKYGRYQ